MKTQQTGLAGYKKPLKMARGGFVNDEPRYITGTPEYLGENPSGDSVLSDGGFGIINPGNKDASKAVAMARAENAAKTSVLSGQLYDEAKYKNAGQVPAHYAKGGLVEPKVLARDPYNEYDDQGKPTIIKPEPVTINPNGLDVSKQRSQAIATQDAKELDLYNKNYGLAKGGPVKGKGTGTSDSIPAKLSDGEYVIPAAVVKKYGKEFFDNLINAKGDEKSDKLGGDMDVDDQGRPMMADGGLFNKDRLELAQQENPYKTNLNDQINDAVVNNSSQNVIYQPKDLSYAPERPIAGGGNPNALNENLTQAGKAIMQGIKTYGDTLSNGAGNINEALGEKYGRFGTSAEIGNKAINNVNQGLKGAGETLVGKQGIADVSQGIENVVNAAKSRNQEIADQFSNTPYGLAGGISNVLSGGNKNFDAINNPQYKGLSDFRQANNGEYVHIPTADAFEKNNPQANIGFSNNAAKMQAISDINSNDQADPALRRYAANNQPNMGLPYQRFEGEVNRPRQEPGKSTNVKAPNSSSELNIYGQPIQNITAMGGYKTPSGVEVIPWHKADYPILASTLSKSDYLSTLNPTYAKAKENNLVAQELAQKGEQFSQAQGLEREKLKASRQVNKYGMRLDDAGNEHQYAESGPAADEAFKKSQAQQKPLSEEEYNHPVNRKNAKIAYDYAYEHPDEPLSPHLAALVAAYHIYEKKK